MIDFNKIDDIDFDGIDHSDAPDYCDAYIVSCCINGLEATEFELDKINNDRDFVYEELMKHLH